MTNSGPLSSIISAAGTKRPLSLLHRPPIPFNMVIIKHPTLEMSASRSLYSLPNWARLGEAIDGTDVVEDGADAPVDHGAAASLNHNDVVYGLARCPFKGPLLFFGEIRFLEGLTTVLVFFCW